MLLFLVNSPSFITRMQETKALLSSKNFKCNLNNRRSLTDTLLTHSALRTYVFPLGLNLTFNIYQPTDSDRMSSASLRQSLNWCSRGTNYILDFGGMKILLYIMFSVVFVNSSAKSVHSKFLIMIHFFLLREAVFLRRRLVQGCKLKILGSLGVLTLKTNVSTMQLLLRAVNEFSHQIVDLWGGAKGGNKLEQLPFIFNI